MSSGAPPGNLLGVLFSKQFCKLPGGSVMNTIAFRVAVVLFCKLQFKDPHDVQRRRPGNLLGVLVSKQFCELPGDCVMSTIFFVCCCHSCLQVAALRPTGCPATPLPPGNLLGVLFLKQFCKLAGGSVMVLLRVFPGQ